MDGDDPQPRDEDAREPERHDVAARASDLARMAEANEHATFGEDPADRRIVPGVLSGDLGPKGRASSQLRSLSRRERAAYGEVPRGAAAPGGGMLLLVPMLVIGVLIIVLVVLVGWLLS